VSLKLYEKETAFQIHCADWLRKQFIVTRNELFAWWHHSANERSSSSEGFNAKMMGQSKGFPDFIHCGMMLAIELKVGKGRLSEEQRAWMQYFRRQGWQTEVCFTAESFRDIVLSAIERHS